MCDETSGLDPAAAAALEAHFLDPEAPFAARGCPAGELVPGRFRAKARSWRERHHPVSIEARHRKGVEDRRLEFVPDRDGMAWLSAYVTADVAAAVWSRATEAARALQGPAESRTLTQLRVDVASGWLLVGVAEGTPSPKAQVLVTVPVLSLMGAGTEPATLDGYGPIPPSMARRLVGDGARSFLRVLTDPRSGAPLEIGRTSYRVPKAMRQWLRLRDGRCSFPGCNNHSLDNEADHVLAWSEGGGTGITNLGQPCRQAPPPQTHHTHGGPLTPPGTSHPAGSHPRDAPIPANNRTGNHHTGRTTPATRAKTRSGNRPTGRTYLPVPPDPERPGHHYRWIPCLTGHCSSRRRIALHGPARCPPHPAS